MQTDLYRKAKQYLTNRTEVLDKMVKVMGYKTCHPIDSLDATKCAEDCKSFEKMEFATKNCTEKGGLFKCCIRRDRMGCNNCRFCCTLPMCTYSPENKISTIFEMDQTNFDK